MRVYELMEQLGKMPAGAEVTASTVVSAEEIMEHDVLEQTEAGENLYSVTGAIDCLEEASQGRVYMYVNLEART